MLLAWMRLPVATWMHALLLLMNTMVVDLVLLTFIKFFVNLFGVHMYRGDRRITCKNRFSPSIMWVLELEFRSARFFIYGAMSVTLVVLNSVDHMVSKWQEDYSNGHLLLPYLLFSFVISHWRVTGKMVTLARFPRHRVVHSKCLQLVGTVSSQRIGAQ